jgi:antitoxin CptB
MSEQGLTETAEDPSAVRRRRLKFRSWHRGTRESDLLVGSFADAHIDGFSEEQLDRFEEILQEEDPDIYDWMNGRAPLPQRVDHDVMHMMLAFNFTPRQGS